MKPTYCAAISGCAVNSVSTPSADVPSPGPAQAAAPPAGANPTTAEPPPAVDDLSYYDRLEKPNPPREALTTEKASESSAREKPSATAAAPDQPRTAAAVTPPTKPPRAGDESASAQRAPESPLAEPAGSGYAVQIAALNVRSEAEAIARRLGAKGYTAYVVAPASGTSMYRVRVGKFSTRVEADSVAAKLQKEEQFKPWITR